ncbi:DUF5391 family protein [Paucisalibacillus globulus]|uniref:DUF5391 family protein n=1 Tax=Paucisalibacillus globulus TaxID=351095 RepID=UPI0004152719|nr:DUF5391 family protein [Paucisalibacillus globulus]
MMQKNKKQKIIITTLVSLILYCLVVILSSLSPLADLGKNANQFGDVGMWATIILGLLFYLVPLLLYLLGIQTIRYVMAVFCGFGIIMALSLVTFIPIISKIMPEISIASSIGVTIASILFLAINIIWYFVVFSRTRITM